MSPEPSLPDIETLWRDQTLESDPMTLEDVHELVRKFDLKARRELVIVGLSLTAAAFIYGQVWQAFHDPLTRAGVALTLAGMLACGYLSYAALHPKRDLAEAAGPYLRRRLQGALRQARGGWLLSLAALLPGIAVLEASTLRRAHGPMWAMLLPQVIMLLAIAFIVVNARRGARRLEQELGQLDRLLES